MYAKRSPARFGAIASRAGRSGTCTAFTMRRRRSAATSFAYPNSSCPLITTTRRGSLNSSLSSGSAIGWSRSSSAIELPPCTCQTTGHRASHATKSRAASRGIARAFNEVLM